MDNFDPNSASSSKEKVKEPKESKLTKQINQESELYSYNKILERANSKDKEPTISELNREINIIKSEIRILKEKVEEKWKKDSTPNNSESSEEEEEDKEEISSEDEKEVNNISFKRLVWINKIDQKLQKRMK